MRRCRNCGEVLRLNDAFCPTCMKPVEHAGDANPHLPPPDDAMESEGDDQQRTPMAAIARFRNAAEAGYFAHELLHQHGIPAAVMLDDSFDALSGYWSTRYVLAVPEDLADAGAAHLKDLADEPDYAEQSADFRDGRTEFDPAEGESPFSDRGPFPSSSRSPAIDKSRAAESDTQASTAASSSSRGASLRGEVAEAPEFSEESGVNWVPIVLTLAAGSVVFWGLRTWHAQNQPQAAAGGQEIDPWDRLATPHKPWVQESEDGAGRRELWFDPRRREAVLREDNDGDGRFETELPIRTLRPKR